MKPGTDFLRNLAVACVPLLLAALGYLFTNALTLHDKVRVLEQKMSILIDIDNKIIPSPGNAIARLELKEQLLIEKNEIDKRIHILEYHVDKLLQGEEDASRWIWYK